MRLSVDAASGRVRLTLPVRASLKRAMAWAEEQRGWIEAQRGRLPEPRPFVPGAVIPVEGEDVLIDWSEDRSRTVTYAPPRPSPGWGEEEGRLVCGGPLEGLSRRIEAWLKKRALTVLSEDTAYYAAKAGVAIARVSVADPRARWGSCASSGTAVTSSVTVVATATVR